MLPMSCFVFIFCFCFVFFYRVEISGCRRALCARESFLVASNHRSFIDPPLIGTFFRYSVTYFARANLWKYPIIGTCLRIFSGIPVDRARPSMETMKKAVSVLGSGVRVLVFPEGTRSKDGFMPLRQGSAMFARRAGVKVLPLYVRGAADIWPRGRLLPRLYGKVHIRVGEPIAVDTTIGKKLMPCWLIS